MNSSNWWYNLSWQDRCRYRELCGVDMVEPELMDKLYEMYGTQ